MKKLLTILLSIAVLAFAGSAFAQEKSKKSQLFDYPVVPDTMSTLEGRANYFLTHFWDKFNFSKTVDNREAFDEAFENYLQMFPHAHRNVVKTSINSVMNRAQSNMKNFWLFADDAENMLYSPEAQVRSEEAYVYFIENILRSSKVKKNEKQRYQAQLVKINTNQVGSIAPDFKFDDLNGNHKNLFDIAEGKIYIILFNDMECSDCAMARLRLSTNVRLNQLIEDGTIVFISITPEKYSKAWAEVAKTYSDTWIIGASADADEKYDLRQLPCIYMLDADKKIIAKQVSADALVDFINNN